MDVAKERIGTVLTQQGKPVTFMSCALGVTKKIMVNLHQRNARNCGGYTCMVTIFIRKKVLHPNRSTQLKIFFGTKFGNTGAAKMGSQIAML